MKAVRFLTMLVLGAMIHVPYSHALSNFAPGDVSALSQETVNTLIDTIAITSDHRSMLPASNLGVLLGVDFGVVVTAVQTPQVFKDAMTLSGASTGDFPSLLPIPRLTLNKGLPFGIDIGGSYFGYQQNKLYGAELKWTFLNGGFVMPSAAIRVSQSYTRLFFMKTRSTKIDALVSKRFGMGVAIDPYVGVGVQLVNGDLDVPVSGPNGLAGSISAHNSRTAAHVYAGLPINLFAFRMTAEYDYSFAKISTFGAKFGFSF